MLPYALTFLIGWALLLVGWIACGVPFGPDVPTFYPGGGS
jgi:p-aminobenzoyl-glutamate transporter AbgT